MMLNRKERQPAYFFLLCRTASLAGTFVGLGWLLVFILVGYWSLAFALLGLGVAILPCWLLARRGNFSAGLLAAQLVCLLFVCLFSLLFDIPNKEVLRTTHLYLLVIALVGYINYQRTPSRQQAGMIIASLLMFVVFCSSRLAFPFAIPMPTAFREISSWVNAMMVTVMLGGGMAALQADFSRQTDIGRQLRRALKQNEFVLYYQLQVSADGGFTGAEALLRWQHPEKGLLSPDFFLPDAQRAGLMPLIGEWVLREACFRLTQWQSRPEMARLTLAVNFTADHILETDFTENVIETVVSAGVNPSQLKFELTESVFATDMPVVVTTMETLAASGFRFALDDFGTGFSSLSYLRQLPLEQIKIDRSFVKAVLGGEKGRVIARNIIRMGRELQLQVLAEGIEEEAQWLIMKTLGCDAFQGYYFARPLSAPDFEKMFSSGEQPERSDLADQLLQT